MGYKSAERSMKNMDWLRRRRFVPIMPNGIQYTSSKRPLGRTFDLERPRSSLYTTKDKQRHCICSKDNELGVREWSRP